MSRDCKLDYVRVRRIYDLWWITSPNGSNVFAVPLLERGEVMLKISRRYGEVSRNTYCLTIGTPTLHIFYFSQIKSL